MASKFNGYDDSILFTEKGLLAIEYLADMAINYQKEPFTCYRPQGDANILLSIVSIALAIHSKYAALYVQVHLATNR